MRYLILELAILTALLITPAPAKDVRGYHIPANALLLLDTMYSEIETYGPLADSGPEFPPFAPYYSALIEQETCISVTRKRSRCWKPTARLHTVWKNGREREHGMGLGQLTRASRSNGHLRFDTLKTLRKKYPSRLGELRWGTLGKRVDLQMRAILVLWDENYVKIKRLVPRANEYNLVAMTDSAYNGGFGGLRKDVRLCERTKGCNKNIWFGNVEKTCTKSKRVLYGGKSACQINREHVYNTMQLRLTKYIDDWIERAPSSK